MVLVVLYCLGCLIVSFDDIVHHLDVFPLCVELLLVDDVLVRLYPGRKEHPIHLFAQGRPGVDVRYDDGLASRKQLLEYVRGHFAGA